MAWYWIAGFACIGIFAVLMVLGFILMAIDKKKKQATLEKGEPVLGWLIMANMKLYEEGSSENAAVVLISPDPETANDDEYMLDLVEKIAEIRETDPVDLDEDEEMVHNLLADETYVQGARTRLPKSITDGRKVFLANVMIFREDLPSKKITKPYIYCQIVWDDPNAMICSRLPNKTEIRARREKDRQREDEDDDD
jgi:hypothetical protein